MEDQAKTKAQLIAELNELREQVVELASEAEAKEQAEEELRFQSEILTQMSEGVNLVRVSDGAIVYTNPRFDELFGYAPGELIGKHIATLNAPTDKTPEETANEIVNSLTGTGRWDGELQNFKKDGTRFWCHAGASVYAHPEHGQVYVTVQRDISECREAEKELIRRSGFERLISEISSSLVGLSVDEMDSGIDCALSRVCQFTEADRAYVFLFRDGGTLMDNTHGWCREGIEPQIEDLRGILLHDDLPWLGRCITACETCRVSDVAVLPPEAQLEREHFEARGIRSLIAVPMVPGGRLTGFLSLDSVRERREWSEEDATVLQFVSEAIAQALVKTAAEKALRESREEFADIFAMSVSLVCIADINEAKFLKVNPAFTRVLGYDEAELLGHSLFEFLHPDDIVPTRKVVEDELKLGKEVMSFANRHRCKDGTWCWLEWTSHPLPERGITFAVGHDITERKQAENALLKSERDYRLLVENANSIILRWNGDGLLTYFNEFAENLFGYSRDEVLGKHVVGTIVPETESTGRDLLPLMNDICVNPKKHEYSVNENVCKDGRCIWVAWTNKTYVNEDTGEIEALSIGMDITEQRRLQEQLRQTEKIEAIGQLAGGVAHDFNNQLGGIMNYADLLLSKTDDEELRPFIDGIIRLCTRSGELTNQLLAFSRKGQYQVVPVSIHQIVGEVVSMLVHSIDRRIQIRQRLDANPPTTTGDPTQLQNALLNLGLNARDAMPEGGELVFATDTVTLDEEHCGNSSFELMPGEYVRTEVTDSGTGMDEETQSKIFEPFFTTKEQGKGTGMGLAAAFGTVVNHRGAIEVESEIGRGTTMTVYLPLSRKEPRGAEAGMQVAAQAAAEGASARILIVDDERSVRECTAKMLRYKGYRVVTCKDGAEAVEYYGKSWQHIDLVILDMNMPVMNGRDAFIAMRGVNAGIRAMLATGYSLDQNAQEILDEGALSYIQKPFRMRELFAQVEQALDG